MCLYLAALPPRLNFHHRADLSQFVQDEQHIIRFDLHLRRSVAFLIRGRCDCVERHWVAVGRGLGLLNQDPNHAALTIIKRLPGARLGLLDWVRIGRVVTHMWRSLKFLGGKRFLVEKPIELHCYGGTVCKSSTPDVMLAPKATRPRGLTGCSRDP